MKKNEIVECAEPGELVTNCDQFIASKIRMIGGVQVMLDRDLAALYGVPVKRLNEQVKRNQDRFPSDFMFQLSKEDCLRSQIATLNGKRGEHLKYLPYVFTENGIAMLSSVLRSPKAIEVNIRIMRAFVAMRRFLLSNAQLFQRIETVEKRQLMTDVKVDSILTRLDAAETPPQAVFYNGQLWDACSLVEKLIARARASILLIDNWVGAGTLDVLAKKRRGVKVTIVTSEHKDRRGNPRPTLAATDIAKFNAQYPVLEVKYNESFHDRFLILDDKELYLIGASLKDLGKKCFAMARLDAGEISGLKARI